MKLLLADQAQEMSQHRRGAKRKRHGAFAMSTHRSTGECTAEVLGTVGEIERQHQRRREFLGCLHALRLEYL